ncbi:MAG TPA: hypothetical protein VNT60_09085 [Deinococcales bacterium]|nr:hypothetical protein [Deinococcales bacterium]
MKRLLAQTAAVLALLLGAAAAAGTDVTVTRQPVSPNPLLPGESVSVNFTVSNKGSQVEEFSLVDQVPDWLQPEAEPRFTGRLAPGETRELSYQAAVTAGPPRSGVLVAALSSPGTSDRSYIANAARENLGLHLGAPKSVRRTGQKLVFRLTISNPLARAVSVMLGASNSTIDLPAGQLGPLTVPPGGLMEHELVSSAESAGVYLLGLTATIDGVAASNQAVARVEVQDWPAAVLESTVSLSVRAADLPVGASLYVADRLPEGASYLPGSSRLNGKELREPLSSGQALFWQLPAPVASGEVSYRISHSAPLTATQAPATVILAVPRGGSSPDLRLLQGDKDLVALLATAQAPPAAPAPAKDRVGAVVYSPLPNTVFRDRDRADVTVDLPLDARDITLTVNGAEVPASQVGRRIYDEGTGRFTLEYSGVKLSAGPNEIRLRALSGAAVLEDTQTVFLAGTPASIAVSTRGPLGSDSVDAPELILNVKDAYGNAPFDGWLTIESSPEPALADGDPTQPGYQVRFTNGQARLPLSAVGARNSVTVSAWVGDLKVTETFPVLATVRPPVATGVISTQVAFSGDEVTGALRVEGFGRWPIDDGRALLTLGADVAVAGSTREAAAISGDLLPPANPLERFPVLGDAAVSGSDAVSATGLFARLQSGGDVLQYGRFTTDFRGVLGGYGQLLNGFSALGRGTNYTVSAFAASRPATTVRQSFPGDGTSLYRLANTPVDPGSERAAVVVRKRGNPNEVVSERPLERLADYSIDYGTGTILLRRALLGADAEGNPQFLRVDYAPDSANAPQDWKGGLQAFTVHGGFGFGATVLYHDAAKPLLVAASAQFKEGPLSAAAEFGWSGDYALVAQADYRVEGFSVNARYGDYGLNFAGPSGAVAERSLAVGLDYTLNERATLTSDFSFAQSHADLSQRTNGSALLRYDLGPFVTSAGLRAQFAPQQVVQAVAGIVVPAGPAKLSIEQRVPLTPGTPAELQGTLEYALTPSLTLVATDTFSFDGNNTASLTLRGRVGNTNLAASYELPDMSGSAGRGRIGVDTTIPLSDVASASLGGEVRSAPNGALLANANVGLAYNTEEVKGTARAQYSLSDKGVKQVYTAGLTLRLLQNLTASPSVEYTTGPDGQGLRFSVAGAYRGEQFSVLVQNSIRTGIFAAGGDVYKGEVQASYSPSEFFSLRGGLAFTHQAATLTAQLSIGLTYFPEEVDWLGIGASFAYLTQPANSTSRLALGLEAGFKLQQDLVVSLGYNFLGFDGIGGATTKPGFYLRLDLKFDERSIDKYFFPPATDGAPLSPPAGR